MSYSDKIVKTKNGKNYRIRIYDDRKTTHDVYDCSGFFDKKVTTTHSMQDVLAWIMATTGSEIEEVKDR